MYWTWAITTDVQLYLMIPFIVILYKKSLKACLIVLGILTLINICTMIYWTYHF